MKALITVIALSLFGTLAQADRVLLCEEGTKAAAQVSLHDPQSLKRLKAKPEFKHLSEVKFNCGEEGFLVLTSAAESTGQVLGCTSGETRPNGIPIRSGLRFSEACLSVDTFVEIYDVKTVEFED